MKEEIPESFWEALVEVKDKDIENARELFLTAMELAKKYKDERDEAWEDLDEEMKFHHRTHGECVMAQCELMDVKNERDEYKIGHDRYEKLRRLSPMQFHELYEKNIKTGEHFDKLVDKLT